MSRLFSWAVFMAGLSSQASAENDLFHCQQQTHFIWGNCALASSVLSERPQYDGESFEAEFQVTYSFPCVGHQVELGVVSATSYRRFVMGAQQKTLYGVIGAEPATAYDPDPTATASLAFQPGCRLVVHEVSFTPSANALLGWNQSAKSQARIIDLSLTVYELARDFAHYRQWDLNKTHTMLTSVMRKHERFQDSCDAGNTAACLSAAHFGVIKNSLQLKINQAPQLPKPEDMSEEVVTVVEHFRTQLDDEVKLGQWMVERFAFYQTQVNAELAAILAAVEGEL